MEFKGTKGKWFCSYTQGSWLIQDLESYQEGFKATIAEVYYFEDGKDTAEANALLISKAPEMLAMLKDIHFSVLNSNIPEDVISLEKIESLIKQVTEL